MPIFETWLTHWWSWYEHRACRSRIGWTGSESFPGSFSLLSRATENFLLRNIAPNRGSYVLIFNYEIKVLNESPYDCFLPKHLRQCRRSEKFLILQSQALVITDFPVHINRRITRVSPASCFVSSLKFMRREKDCFTVDDDKLPWVSTHMTRARSDESYLIKYVEEILTSYLVCRWVIQCAINSVRKVQSLLRRTKSAAAHSRQTINCTSRRLFAEISINSQ